MARHQETPNRPKAASGKTRKPLKAIPSKKAAGRKAAAKKEKEIRIDIRSPKKDLSGIIDLLKRKLPEAPKAKIPSDLKPMLATLVDEPFNDSGWQFELKLDGYRALAYVQKGKAELRSRNNLSFNKKFGAVYEALLNWPVDAVVDGEIVVLDDQGVPDFNGIQQWEKKRSGQLVFYVFDLLWIDGLDIMKEPLYLRREILRQIIPETGPIRFSDHIEEVGKQFFDIAWQNNLEGIVAKKMDAPYIPDSRSKSWLKIKIEQRHEAVICGYTRKQDSDRLFSSLILGVVEKEKLVFIGQTGTGFSVAMQQDIMKKMKPLLSGTCPFEKLPEVNDKPVWIRPSLVCEVKYTELTKEGVMRHASFQGLRPDKSLPDFNNETETGTEKLVGKKKEGKMLPQKPERVVSMDGHELKLTNLDKIFWPKEKITKGDLLGYYERIAPFMLPYMKDRPQSLNRFPNGVAGKNFYHKNMGGKVDPWLKTFQRFSESNGEPKDFLICTNAASIVYMANLGCIEMNPWHSRTISPNYPDWCVIDLDPGEISFEKVIETALVVGRVLDTLGIPSFPKTSGSTGIHIYIPLGAKYNYEQSRQLAELIANLVHEELPTFTSLVRNPAKRQDKIYVDYLQNRPIQTICAPYSVRPKPGATVSAPLHWTEVKKGLKISQFTMKNIFERLKTEGDLFEGVLQHSIDLNRVLKSLASLF
jgi:bifunctional non-homologous end joining protein LigD